MGEFPNTPGIIVLYRPARPYSFLGPGYAIGACEHGGDVRVRKRGQICQEKSSTVRRIIHRK